MSERLRRLQVAVKLFRAAMSEHLFVIEVEMGEGGSRRFIGILVR